MGVGGGRFLSYVQTLNPKAHPQQNHASPKPSRCEVRGLGLCTPPWWTYSKVQQLQARSGGLQFWGVRHRKHAWAVPVPTDRNQQLPTECNCNTDWPAHPCSNENNVGAILIMCARLCKAPKLPPPPKKKKSSVPVVFHLETYYKNLFLAYDGK